MKVLFWIDTFPTVSETFIRNQIVDLINIGIDIDIFCNFKNEDKQGIEGFEKYNLLNKTNDFRDIVPQSKKEKIKKILKILANSFATHNFWYYIRFLKLLILERKKNPLSSFFILNFILKNKIEVVHCHFGPIGKKAVFIKKIGLPVKLVCTFHGYDIRLGIKKDKSFYKNLFDYADSIISISKYNEEKLLSFGLQHKKINHLHNGVEINFDVKKKNREENKVKILSVGRLVEDKGYDLALDAINVFVKKNPGIKFQYDIIGGGVLEDKLIKKCIDLNIDSVVNFHLSQNSEFVKNKMLDADFLFLPSINEALPMVVLEAQSYGLPVLATNVGSVKDLVIDDITGYLSSISEFDLVQCLEKMFKNKEKWQMYGSNAKKNIILNYDRVFLAQKLIKIYKK